MSPPKAIAHGTRIAAPPRTTTITEPSAVAFPEGADAVIALSRTSTLFPCRSVTHFGLSRKSTAAAPSSCVRTPSASCSVRVERFVTVNDAFTRQPAPVERPSASVDGDAAISPAVAAPTSTSPAP